MAAKVKALQQWCKIKCDGYRDVIVRNMTSSWKSGMAFCAIIHRYRPDLIDYDSLTPDKVFENNKLAFTVAEEYLGIPALLDAEDMVAMAVPDKLCIVTYVAQYYNYFRNKSEEGGPGVKGKMAAKRPRPPASLSPPPVQKSKGAHEDPVPSSGGPTPAKRSTLGDSCAICRERVFIMERHIEGSKLYHRRCLRERQRSNRSSGGSVHGYTTKSTEGVPGKENTAPAASLPAKVTASVPSNGLLSRLHAGPAPYGASAKVGEKDKGPGGSPLLNMLCGGPAAYGGGTPASASSISSTKTSPANHVISQNSPKCADSDRRSPRWGRKDSPADRPVVSKKPDDPTPTARKGWSPSGDKNPAGSGGIAAKTDASSSKGLNVRQPAKVSPHQAKHSGSGSNTSSSSSGGNQNGHGTVLTSLLSSLADVRKRQSTGDDDVTSSVTSGRPQKECSLEKIARPTPRQNAWKPVTEDKPRVTARNGITTTTVSSPSSPHGKTSRGVTSTSSSSPKLGGFTPSSSSSSSSPSHGVKTTPPRPTTSVVGTTVAASSPRASPLRDTQKTTSPPKSPRQQTQPQRPSPAPRQPRPSSPRSILKQSSAEERSPGRGGAHKHVKLSSPFLDGEWRDGGAKKMLKPAGEGGVSSYRSRSSSPPKSILKSLDNSPGEDAAGRLGSQPKSILKSKESLEEGDAEEAGDAGQHGPRPILKGTRSHSADGVEGLLRAGDGRLPSPARSILKHSLEGGDDEGPKSILKHSAENLSGADAAGEPGGRRMRTAMKHGSVDLEDERYGSLMEELRARPGGAGAASSSHPGGPSTSPPSIFATSPPKSILKKKSPEQRAPGSGGAGPSLAKSVWQSPVPVAAKSSGVPQVSSSFSGARSRSSADPPPSSTANNFSAFNLNDSFSLTGEGRGEEGAAPVRSAWQIEVEARQGVKPKPTNLADQLSRQMEAAISRKESAAKQQQQERADRGEKAGKEEDRPAWQVEAEKRQAARKGRYDDPEHMKGKTPSPTPPGGEAAHRPARVMSSPPPAPASRLSPPPRTSPRDVRDSAPQAPPRKGKTHDASKPKTYTSVFNKSPPPGGAAAGWPHRAADRGAAAAAAPGAGYPSPGQPSYGGMDLASIISRQMGRGKGPAPRPPPGSPPPPVPPRTPPKDRAEGKGALSRSPAFRISPDASPSMSDKDMKPRSDSTSSTGSSSDSSRSPRLDDDAAGFRPIAGQRAPPGGAPPGGRRVVPASLVEQSLDFTPKNKLRPETMFSFQSGDFELKMADAAVVRRSGGGGLEGTAEWMRTRPLPSPPGSVDQATPKRTVNAEARVATNQILVYLEQLDLELRTLEAEGRLLEEKIRQESDEAMDEDVLMIQWFELVNRKNELVRKESEFMYKQRAQELEDLHEDLEYEFRCLMEKPAHEKTSSERVREETLLQEILETVTLRNHIVDSMEEDRLRYLAEDKEIASMMSVKNLSNPPGKHNKKKKKRNKVKKSPTKNKSPDDGNDKKKDRKFFKISIGSGGK